METENQALYKAQDALCKLKLQFAQTSQLVQKLQLENTSLQEELAQAKTCRKESEHELLFARKQLTQAQVAEQTLQKQKAQLCFERSKKDKLLYEAHLQVAHLEAQPLNVTVVQDHDFE